MEIVLFTRFPSVSKGNVIYADDLVEFFGVDAVRYFVLHEMPFENDGTLIFTGNRLDKFRMCINMLDQPVCILTHLKKVCFLPVHGFCKGMAK